MKKTMINLILTSLLLAAGTATPLCYPGEPACPIKAGMATQVRFNGPGDPPLCYPGEPACPIR